MGYVAPIIYVLSSSYDRKGSDGLFGPQGSLRSNGLFTLHASQGVFLLYQKQVTAKITMLTKTFWLIKNLNLNLVD